MANTLSNLSVVAFIVAAAALAIALFLFFFFKIPKVLSDLSGRTARRSVAKIRSGNEAALGTFTPAGLSGERNHAGSTLPLTQTGVEGEEVTEISSRNNPDPRVFSRDIASELSGSTRPLDADASAGAVDDETAVLNGAPQRPAALKPRRVKLTVLETVVITHTHEVIS